MFGLTSLGVFHTAISLIAVGAGIIALLRYRQITSQGLLGQVYVFTTLVSCVTGFGIFQHGGFGKPHALGIVTLIALVVALVAERTQVFGKLSPYLRTVSYSATFLFHWIPGITETSTRLPVGAPLLASAEAPELKVAAGLLFVLFLLGATLQVLALRKAAVAPGIQK